MLDYVNWYLVELEHRLRHHRDSSDLILETRSHLEERVDDLMTKGFDRSEATKRAIAEFGDPDEIANQAIGFRRMSTRALVLWSIALGLAMVSWLPAMFAQMLGRGPYDDASTYLTGPAITLIVVSILTIRFRNLIGVTTCAAAACFAICGALIAAGMGTPVHVPNHGQTTFVGFAAMPQQIEMREQWLAKSAVELAALNVAFAKRDWPTLLGTQKYPPFWGPNSNELSYGSPRVLISDMTAVWPATWIRLGPSTFGRHSVSAGFYRREDAIQAWNKLGKEYLAGVEAHRRSLALEVETLKAPTRFTYFQRLTFVTMGIFALLCVTAPFILLANLTILGVSHVLRKSRSRAWRRKLA